MQVTLNLPDDVIQGLEQKWKDLPRGVLESVALEGYRSRALTQEQVRRMLGFGTRIEVDSFLKERGAFDYTVADLEQDRETLRQLRSAR
ncbi:MAG: UPF0175 family protein [Acidobacteria bacterium]|nr:UPF0175 family protein [Acidobacteriota bacterium]